MTRVTGASVFASAVGNVADAAAGGLNVQNRELVHDAHPWRVKIGGRLQAEAAYTVVGVSRSLGMKHVDSATVISERAASPTPFLAGAQIRPVEINQTLEIFDAATGDVKFWGIVEEAEFHFGESPDHKTLLASIQPHHFGEPITNAQFLSVRITVDNAPTAEFVQVDDPLVFNGWPAGDRHMAVPTGSLAVTGNKTRIRYAPIGRDGKPLKYQCNLFVPLDTLQTPGGRARYAGYYDPFANNGLWTLRDAVRYLCAVGNVRGLIANPTDADLETVPEVPLYRTEIPLPITLGDALDRLLGQYGLYWYVDPNAGAANRPAGGGGFFAAAVQAVANVVSGATTAAKPRIRFAARGVGPEVDASYAKPGATADFATTNVREFRARYSLAPTVNEVHVLGGRVMVEGTWELQKVSGDKWALNEAAEYGDLGGAPYRPFDDPNLGSTEAVIPALSDMFPPDVFGDLAQEISLAHIQRRRRFLPTLNLVGTGEQSPGGGVELRPRGAQHGVEIEIIDRDQEDSKVPDQASKVWISLAEHPLRHKMLVRLAEDECAIYLDSGHNEESEGDDEYDQFVVALAENKRMRITATIESDLRIQVRVKRANADNVPSVQSRPVVFVWEDEDRFPCRRILLTGAYKSKWGEGSYTAQTPRASAVIQQMRNFAEQLLAGSDQATISGQIQFMHLDYDVPLGGIVEKIAGRDLHLLASHADDDPRRFPQIVAIHHDVQNNVTTATLSAEPDTLLDAFA